ASTGVVPRAAWLRSALSAYVVEWFELERVDVELYGHVAVANVRYSQRAIWEGEPLAYTFLITDVWVSRDARWQLVARHSSPLPERGRELPLAVESVRARGRHAIIADFCDLAAVAGLEDVYASALLDSIAAPEDERPVLREAMTRLFESGLATGLVLSAAP